MKAAAFTEFGGPEVLHLMEVEEPRAGPGQVRMKVKAAGVQPFDIGIRQGWTPPTIDPSFPRIPGNEFSGVIDQVDAGVDGYAVGDPVLGYSLLGSYAEYLAVPADQIVVKPDSMPWEIAGGSPRWWTSTCRAISRCTSAARTRWRRPPRRTATSRVDTDAARSS